MSKILIAIPNICEGKDKTFINSLEAKLKEVKNLEILDISMDSVRNRTVFAYTGSLDALEEGGLIIYEMSLQHIDMRKHKGEYPRIGAVDSFPFVPLKGITMEEAVNFSLDFGKKVGKTFGIPVYMFSESARFPLRKFIDDIRRNEYEGLEEQLKDPRWKPDFGSDTFKVDSGATIIGARYPMVSFKIFLNTNNIEISKKICSAIQYETGGLKHIKSYSGIDETKDLAQITVSLSNYDVTPMYQVIEGVRTEARRFGLTIVEVEMIGLIPEKAFLDSAMYYMNINNFSLNNILETNIQEHLNEKMFFVK